MQNNDYGWGAFERNIDNKIFNKIPFNDQKNMLDPSTADVTARVIEMVGRISRSRGESGVEGSYIRKGLQFLKDEQESFGGWFGRWGVNYIYGTWSVFCALEAIGESMEAPYIRKSVEWLKRIQNEDGGWVAF